MGRRLHAALAATTAALLGLTSCSLPGNAATGGGEIITIAGFAVPESANKAIAAAFTQTDAGEGVRFRTSYGASGDQSRAVVAGLGADYVHFSVATDVTRLVDEGLVAEDWDQGPNGGVVSSSVVVFGVREGNPKNIRTWADLVRPGVEIITPNPAASGAARWNALAAWGQVVADGGTEAEAAEYLDAFFGNVIAMPGSGRDATTSFLAGTGDVLMGYENEAILAAQHGQGFEYVVPDTTLLVENPGAVLIDATPAATEWLQFVVSDAGQTEFAQKGFRPIRDDVDLGGDVVGATDPSHPYPEVPNLLTIADDFGDWASVTEKFFAEDGGIVTTAIAHSGKATR